MKPGEEIFRIGIDGRFESRSPQKVMRRRVEVVAALLAAAREGFRDADLHLELLAEDQSWEVRAELAQGEEWIDVSLKTRGQEW